MSKRDAAIAAATEADMIRFWSNVGIHYGLGCCWEWGGTYYRDYPWVSIQGRMVRGHRAAYWWAKGPIPPDMTVDHECQNHRCVNPNHLSLKTNEANAAINGGSRVAAVRRSAAARGAPA